MSHVIRTNIIIEKLFSNTVQTFREKQRRYLSVKVVKKQLSLLEKNFS